MMNIIIFMRDKVVGSRRKTEKKLDELTRYEYWEQEVYLWWKKSQIRPRNSPKKTHDVKSYWTFYSRHLLLLFTIPPFRYLYSSFFRLKNTFLHKKLVSLFSFCLPYKKLIVTLYLLLKPNLYNSCWYYVTERSSTSWPKRGVRKPFGLFQYSYKNIIYVSSDL